MKIMFEELALITIVIVPIQFFRDVAIIGELQGWHIIWQWILIWLAITFYSYMKRRKTVDKLIGEINRLNQRKWWI